MKAIWRFILQYSCATVYGMSYRCRLEPSTMRHPIVSRPTPNNRMQGPMMGVVNSRPKPRPTITTDPTKATKRSEDFSVPVGAMFIGDVVEEHARVLHEAERRMKREEMLEGEDSSVAFDAAKFAANGPQVLGSSPRRRSCLRHAFFWWTHLPTSAVASYCQRALCRSGRSALARLCSRTTT